jgi:hypothetical protein
MALKQLLVHEIGPDTSIQILEKKAHEDKTKMVYTRAWIGSLWMSYKLCGGEM